MVEFDKIFKLIDENIYFIDINLSRKLFESDFYLILDNKINIIIKTINIIIKTTNINSLSIYDTSRHGTLCGLILNIKLFKKLMKYIIKIPILNTQSLKLFYNPG
jgi:hypothetical protein